MGKPVKHALGSFCLNRVRLRGKVFREPRFTLILSMPIPTRLMSTRCLFLGFRFFEAEEVKVAAGVAGDDELESVGKCAAMRGAIAGEGGQDFSGFELPHLQRVVLRRGDRKPPVPTQRHAP